MFEASPVSLKVQTIQRHRVRICAENSWFVHIVPEGINVARPFKVFEEHLLAPELLSIFVKEVNPC
jgi:hypothetical protein